MLNSVPSVTIFASSWKMDKDCGSIAAAMD